MKVLTSYGEKWVDLNPRKLVLKWHKKVVGLKYMRTVDFVVRPWWWKLKISLLTISFTWNKIDPLLDNFSSFLTTILLFVNTRLSRCFSEYGGVRVTLKFLKSSPCIQVSNNLYPHFITPGVYYHFGNPKLPIHSITICSSVTYFR